MKIKLISMLIIIIIIVTACGYKTPITDNETELIPDQCAVTSGFSCIDFQLTTDNLKISITNNMGTNITINETTITINEEEIMCETTTESVSDGENFGIVCIFNQNLELGTKQKISLTTNFYNNQGFNHEFTGSLNATVK
ncbi:hypothetical protein K9L67_01525 [Candidatus Woesearchaeota archaeon]|nr:hypothetical protein [Candidatus Woesearchaeota archaeon]MCF7900883.1 hypothetical protein [Candidatus Woesearchaeota archaeon]MCF8013068.1 hypothetical protein [Candidatus Woesearchaeota archaeon]